MEINKLYSELSEAYSNENLNKITRNLIGLYKSKQYYKIRAITNKISKYVIIDEEKDARCFSKLMMLYHPDKGEHFRKKIYTFYQKNDYRNLQQYSHILLLPDVDISPSAVSEDIGYNPEYGFDADTHDGFSYTHDDSVNDELEEVVDYERNFYNLIKIREYGKVDVEFPSYYLEDYEEFEMASSALESLEGIEYCIHAKVLDLSFNSISDIGLLWNLDKLEELYLADNQIGYIDVLSNLTNLKILDISNNQIDDISPLLSLEGFEYIDLTGNPIPESQIYKLRNKDVVVIF
jgi:Leucine-rich repeat (LRR) protein